MNNKHYIITEIYNELLKESTNSNVVQTFLMASKIDFSNDLDTELNQLYTTLTPTSLLVELNETDPEYQRFIKVIEGSIEYILMKYKRSIRMEFYKECLEFENECTDSNCIETKVKYEPLGYHDLETDSVLCKLEVQTKNIHLSLMVNPINHFDENIGTSEYNNCLICKTDIKLLQFDTF